MTKVVSEDALKARLQGDRRDGRRGLACAIISPFACSRCLPNPGSSIVDATTKPLYGHREGAALGANPKKPAEETRRRNPPKKPGRPSHCYLTCSMASRRLVLDVDVSPGDAPASLAQNAEPLTRLQKWRAILSRAFTAFLNGRLIRPPPRLAPS